VEKNKIKIIVMGLESELRSEAKALE